MFTPELPLHIADVLAPRSLARLPALLHGISCVLFCQPGVNHTQLALDCTLSSTRALILIPFGCGALHFPAKQHPQILLNEGIRERGVAVMGTRNRISSKEETDNVRICPGLPFSLGDGSCCP